MPAYNVFFYGALFFLTGIFLKSIDISFAGIFLFIFVLEVVALVLFLYSQKSVFVWFSVLVALVFAGGFYFEADNKQFQENYVLFGEEIPLSGIVDNNPMQKESFAEFKFFLNKPYQGSLLVKLPLYPNFKYGDELILKGVVEKPFSQSYGNYLAKEGIIGVADFPQVDLISENNGSKIKKALFDFRNKMANSFKRVLPFEEAAFLSGLTLGGRSDFSKNFKEAMKKSGTTHLVALSGYNITIIAWAMANFFAFFFKRKKVFALTTMAIIGFVIMTGAEASVTRAAVMGMLILLASQVGRIYDVRNALMLAGLVMVLLNPKILTYDLGFQFSFLALMGIVYLKPAIQKFFNISEDTGFLSLKDHFLNTTAAQIAVAPLLVFSVKSFLIIFLLANLLILETVPLTMFLGFLVASSSLISYYLSTIIGWITWPFLAFQISVIKLFARFNLEFNPNLGAGMIAAYYVLLIFFIYYVQKYIRRVV